MVEYLDPYAMKFILATAAVALIVAIADIVLLVRRRGTARLERLLPAVDSILVIAGFMAFTGTGIVLIRSAGKIASYEIAWMLTFRVMLSALTTAIIAWLLFFVFFEVWFLLRLLYRQYMKRLPASS